MVGTFNKIWQQVKKIPPGKVSTYGEIAQKLGMKDARVVGWALHANRDPKVPCHRVVNHEGKLAENFAFGGWQEQKMRLLEEGVTFTAETIVNLNKHAIIKLLDEASEAPKYNLGETG